MSVAQRMVLLAVATILVTTMPVEGQVAGHAGPTRDGAIVGLVEDEASEPLTNVSVFLESIQQMTRTDAKGAFRFDGLAPGTYDLSLRLIGYTPVTRAVAVSGVPVAVRIEMTALPQTLEAVRISRRRALLADVYARESKGLGAVLYSEDIPQYQQSNVADLLRFAPELAAELAGVKSCTGRVAYFVDGRPLPRGWKIDGYVRLEEIEAIETHSSADFLKDSRLAQGYIPASERASLEFGALRLGTPESPLGLLTGTCTRIVLVWTKHYRPTGD